MSPKPDYAMSLSGAAAGVERPRCPINPERKGCKGGGRKPEGPRTGSGLRKWPKSTPGPKVLSEATTQPPPNTKAEKPSWSAQITAVPARTDTTCVSVAGRKGRGRSSHSLLLLERWGSVKPESGNVKSPPTSGRDGGWAAPWRRFSQILASVKPTCSRGWPDGGRGGGRRVRDSQA